MIRSYPVQVEQIFEQVLLVCAQEGLLGKELFAIDGCKHSSDASKEGSGTVKEWSEKRTNIKRQIQPYLHEHQRNDQDSNDDSKQRRE